MGSKYLTELANWCREAGLTTVEMAGWQTRARSSGGYDGTRPWCVMWHHTASGQNVPPENDASYITTRSPVAPISNLMLDRTGTVWVCAAGATNTNGKGNAMQFSLGTVPVDQMNTHAIAIEACNDGLGEPWPQPQVDAYFKLNNKLTEKLGLQYNDIGVHSAYAPLRKIDPARAEAVQGPWKPRSVNTSGSWNLEDVRSEAVVRAGGTPPEPIPPEPPPTGTYTVVAGDSWWKISQMYGITVDQLVAMNPPATSSTVIHPGDVLNVPASTTPPDPTPPDPTPPPSNGGYAWMASLPTIKKGATGDYVERMQHLLAAAGFMDPANPKNYDGVWGSGTDTAKRNFDNAHGLASSNTDCGPKSWESLMTGKKW